MEQATKNQINELVTEKRAARTTAELWSEPVLSNLFFEIAAPCVPAFTRMINREVKKGLALLGGHQIITLYGVFKLEIESV